MFDGIFKADLNGVIRHSGVLSTGLDLGNFDCDFHVAHLDTMGWAGFARSGIQS